MDLPSIDLEWKTKEKWKYLSFAAVGTRFADCEVLPVVLILMIRSCKDKKYFSKYFENTESKVSRARQGDTSPQVSALSVRNLGPRNCKDFCLVEHFNFLLPLGVDFLLLFGTPPWQKVVLL